MKTSRMDEVREMYAATADSYAEMMDAEIQLPVYSEVLERLHSNIEGLSGAVIDTACGSGHMLSMCRDFHDPLRELIGIDLSPRMVSITRERLGPGAAVFVGDMRYLHEIESSSPAALLNWYAIHHLSVSGVQEAMKEWNRILVPAGRIRILRLAHSGYYSPEEP